MDIIKRKIGKTNLAVSEFSMGTAPIGGWPVAVNSDEAHETLEAAWDNGIRYFDTAPLYGSGMAEERLGNYLKNKPIVAVVIEMPHKKIYSAIKNEGAWCEGIPICCSKTGALRDSLLITGFGYNHDELWEKNMKLFKYFTHICHGVRRLGSAAIDICHVATGQADGFWEFDLKPWDTAAGILIAEESGCSITKLDGAKYNIHEKSILVTNGNIHSELIKSIKDQLN